MTVTRLAQAITRARGLFSRRHTIAVLDTFSGQIDASADDAHEVLSSGEMQVDDGTLRLGQHQGDFGSGEEALRSGVRFAGVFIAQGAPVPYAHVRFTARNQNTDPLILRIRAEAIDNATAFATASGNLSARAVSTAFVDWNVPAWQVNLAGADTTTPNIGPIIEEIVGRAGWTPGNVIAVLFEVSPENTSTIEPRRRAYAYDHTPEQAARLLINTVDETPIPPSPDYLNDPFYDDPVAFEGAMGFGANVTGGRGNGTNGDTALYFVDNLNDSGAGSLRAALEATGKRVVVPRVAGYTTVDPAIAISSDVTYLGMLAPGGGLAVRPTLPHSRDAVLRTTNSNIILRYLRARAGEGSGTNQNAFRLVAGSSDIILDHCSFSWGSDQIAAMFSVVTDVTMQNCLLGEAFAPANQGLLIGDYRTKRISMLYNLLMTGRERFPYWRNGPLNDMYGNVIYNGRRNMFFIVGSNTPAQADSPTLNARRNTWKQGPNYTGEVAILVRNQASNAALRGSLYLEGNSYQVSNQPGLIDDPQWASARVLGDEAISGTLDEWRLTSPLPTPAVVERSASEAYDYVLATAGHDLPRDSADARFVNETATGTGPSGTPSTVAEVGGYPSLASGSYPAAADGVIADAWRSWSGESREWYELDSGGTKRMILENYADDVAQGRFTP